MLMNPDNAMLVKQTPGTVWLGAFESEQPRAVSFTDIESRAEMNRNWQK